MKIAMTGATGFIGRKLCLALQRRGHTVVALVRDEVAAASLLGAEVSLVPIEREPALRRAIGGADAVVNLAGAPIAQPWTKARRKRIVDSRIGVTRRLVDAIDAARNRPRVLVSASAVGVYGDRGDLRLSEDASPGRGFAAELCLDWEAEARRAERLGVRTVIPRIGVVLGEDGGALPSLARVIQSRLGAILGTGDQYVPIIDVDDLVRLLVAAIEDPRYEGIVNATAPEPTTHRALMNALADRLGRGRPKLRVPAALVRLGGEATSIVLASQRAVPTRALALGFEFDHPDLEASMANLLDDAGLELGRADVVPSWDYFAGESPRYRLRAISVVDAPREEVCEFFARPENLGVMTPRSMQFEILESSDARTRTGSEFRYRIRLHGVPMPWKTRIETFDAPERFVDVQLTGPYRHWLHEHRFEALPEGRTRVTDTVWYEPRFGVFGRIAHSLFVRADLRRVFGFRARAMALRFGRPETNHAAQAASRSVA